MTSLLTELRAAGFRLRVEGDTLRVHPSDRLTPELRERIAAAKPILLAGLAAEAAVQVRYRNLPAGLPWMVEYQVGSMVLTTLPRRPVRYVSSSGKTDAPIVRPQLPMGCSGWRVAGETEWKPLSAIPLAWKPFLQRPRGSEGDPRPARAEADIPDSLEDV